MDCDFTEKISQLIDDELSEEEAKGARAHLATCVACQSIHEDFLRLRGEIKSYDATSDLITQHHALRRILASDKPPFWKRSIVLPVPAFALLLMMVVSLGLWFTFLRPSTSTKTERNPERVLTAPAPAQKDAQGALDLARFDRGERASIYKTRRINQRDVEQ